MTRVKLPSRTSKLWRSRPKLKLKPDRQRSDHKNQHMWGLFYPNRFGCGSHLPTIASMWMYQLTIRSFFCMCFPDFERGTTPQARWTVKLPRGWKKWRWALVSATTTNSRNNNKKQLKVPERTSGEGDMFFFLNRLYKFILHFTCRKYQKQTLRRSNLRTRQLGWRRPRSVSMRQQATVIGWMIGW